VENPLSPSPRRAPAPSSPLRGTNDPVAAESREREAAFGRAQALAGEPDSALCAPDVPGLNPELLYTLVAENVRDYAIFLMDPHGVIRCWGEGARLMKWWTRHQAEGAHLRLLYPDGGSEDGTAEEHLDVAARTGEYNGEGHRMRSDGSTFWAYVTLTALRNEAGAVVGFTKVTRDFTARRAVEAALRARAHAAGDAQRVLEDANRQKMLVASISHEVRAPLNAILGSVSLLEAQVGGPERQAAHVERLKQNARHLMQIINDMLDLSRAEAGSLSVSRSARRIGPAIDEALADVVDQAAARGITLTNSVSGAATDLPYLGDEARVRQIVVNLLSNAIKFTDPPGEVTISGGTGETVTDAELAGAGPWIYIRVEDTGRGIPPDRLGVIFEPYQQSDLIDQQRGAGLGLSISRQLARLMGGDIGVRNTPGEGSTFTLWLPIAPTENVPR
jgi:PAS domain S-box-containing protein